MNLFIAKDITIQFMDFDEKKRPRVGVGVVVVQNKQVLLGKRKGSHGAGMWSLSGGHLEFGESVEECAKRELAEETGLKALDIRIGPWTNDIIDGDKHYVTLYAFVHRFDGQVQLLEPHKCEGWQWFDLNALPSPLFGPLQTLLRSFHLIDF